MTFESSYDTYINNYVPNPDWTPSDPRKLWHIIYNVPAASAGEVAALALERGAGLIHITDDILPNPYDTLPDDAYMQTIMNAVEGGSPHVADPLPYPADGQPASQPASISVTGSDYSSVSLSWETSTQMFLMHTRYFFRGKKLFVFRVQCPALLSAILSQDPVVILHLTGYRWGWKRDRRFDFGVC